MATKPELLSRIVGFRQATRQPFETSFRCGIIAFAIGIVALQTIEAMLPNHIAVRLAIINARNMLIVVILLTAIATGGLLYVFHLLAKWLRGDKIDKRKSTGT